MLVSFLMSVKKIMSIILAVVGGLAVLGAIGFLVWALVMGGNDETALPEEALEGQDYTPEVAVNIYFGHEEQTAEDYSNLAEARRSTPRSDLIAYTMEEMIAGPDEEERARGLFSELEVDDTQNSACGGDDFAIEADNDAFLIWLCRETINYGDGHADSVAVSQIYQTMSQFPDVGELFVFDRERNCYGDTEGVNECYERLPSGITP